MREVWETAAAVVASLGGGGLIVIGLSTWLGRVWAERILSADRAKYAREIAELQGSLERTTRLLQGEIEKTIFVSKTHFETEFQILREIWEKVARVRSRMAQLRPVVSIRDARMTPDEILNQHFNEFVPTVADLVGSVDRNSPFYPAEIFASLDQLIHVAQRERDDIAVSDAVESLSSEGRQRGTANFREYCTLTNTISLQIRLRLATLAVRGLPSA